MTVIISMLRGINVGAHNRVKMDALRAVYESLGLRNVQTYVQSGNVIFTTRAKKPGPLTKRIEDAIERKFGFRSRVIARTIPELRDVIARNPFAQRRDIEPSRLLVTFFPGDPGPEATANICKIKTDPEELYIDGSEIYTYYPNGMAKPKLSWPTVERILKMQGTGRNWNSVTRMLEMAEKLETSE